MADLDTSLQNASKQEYLDNKKQILQMLENQKRCINDLSNIEVQLSKLNGKNKHFREILEFLEKRILGHQQNLSLVVTEQKLDTDFGQTDAGEVDTKKVDTLDLPSQYAHLPLTSLVAKSTQLGVRTPRRKTIPRRPSMFKPIATTTSTLYQPKPLQITKKLSLESDLTLSIKISDAPKIISQTSTLAPLSRQILPSRRRHLSSELKEDIQTNQSIPTRNHQRSISAPTQPTAPADDTQPDETAPHQQTSVNPSQKAQISLGQNNTQVPLNVLLSVKRLGSFQFATATLINELFSLNCQATKTLDHRTQPGARCPNNRSQLDKKICEDIVQWVSNHFKCQPSQVVDLIKRKCAVERMKTTFDGAPKFGHAKFKGKKQLKHNKNM